MLSPDGELYLIRKTFFGNYKLELVPSIRYTYQSDIKASDKNGVWVYEGDIVKLDDKYICVVTFVPEFSSYILLDEHNLMYYYLHENVCDRMEVIGNVLENNKLLNAGKNEVEENGSE